MNNRFLSILYILDLISLEDITDVVTSQLYNTSSFDKYIELYYLNKKSRPNEVLESLNRLGNKIRNDEFKGFNKLLMNGIFNLEVDWNVKRSILMKYWGIYSDFLDEEYEFFSRLSDDFYLRKDGLPGCMIMPEELYSYLNKYNKTKNYSLKNLLFDIINDKNGNI